MRPRSEGRSMGRTSSTTSFIRSALRTSRSETWPRRGRRLPRLRPPAPAKSSTSADSGKRVRSSHRTSGAGSTPTQPIALADTVRYLAAVAGRGETIGETYDLGGPEVMTYRQMIERVADMRRKRRAIIEVPVLTPFLSSLWLHLVTPVGASVARPLVEGLRNPTVAEDSRILDLVPFPLTPFDRAAREALDVGDW